MANEKIFEAEVPFHDSATIRIAAHRVAWDRSVGGQAITDGITLTISTAVSINFDLSVEEADQTSRMLAAAVKALRSPRAP
jgi:hypothetical protein